MWYDDEGRDYTGLKQGTAKLANMRDQTHASPKRKDGGTEDMEKGICLSSQASFSVTPKKDIGVKDKRCPALSSPLGNKG